MMADLKALEIIMNPSQKTTVKYTTISVHD